ncbi:vitellin-degrading protease-like [Lucilia cuprina]|uniref:vitellin-degrading protease-like n=1 Tax=Lucilia cuprina TaxID=7375 RepID=UPI001F050D21|nr:vitellin-degrading protease-like [Lucilia cuprina]
MFSFLLTIVILNLFPTTHSQLKYASEGEHPYEVAILYNGVLMCAGALVKPDYIATAAHCVNKLSYRYMRVVVGITDAGNFSDINVKFPDGIIVHPRYTPSTREFDIALVKLREPITSSYEFPVEPIELIFPDYEVKYNDFATLVYWDRSDGIKLARAYVSLWHPYNCTAIYIYGEESYHNEVPLPSENTFCASIPDGVCIHDDASSLVIKDKLLGIVSFNELCEATEFPLVCSNIAIYGEWFERVWNN